MEFMNATGKSFNTVHDNDINFYYHVNEVIQEEPLEMIDAETRGLLASIGIEKGKEFNPDERMKRILTDAVAIGNATARSIVWYPRTSGNIANMKGVQVYPDTESAWIVGWVNKNVFFNGDDGHTMNSDARVMFHYPYTGVTPAMGQPFRERVQTMELPLWMIRSCPLMEVKLINCTYPLSPRPRISGR
jgi:hypothetical protein